jgi:hypothetical protein
VKVDGTDARCIQESLWKEPPVGEEKEDVDGVVDQSVGEFFSRCVCAVEHWDRM